MQQIADKLGLSRATVSKALKNSSDLSRETILRVQRAAGEFSKDPEGPFPARRKGAALHYGWEKL